MCLLIIPPILILIPETPMKCWAVYRWRARQLRLSRCVSINRSSLFVFAFQKHSHEDRMSVFSPLKNYPDYLCDSCGSHSYFCHLYACHHWNDDENMVFIIKYQQWLWSPVIVTVLIHQSNRTFLVRGFNNTILSLLFLKKQSHYSQEQSRLHVTKISLKKQ